MTQEDYVSYEVAKLLKEKGFDWECLAYWFIGTDRNFSISKTPQNWNEVKTDLDWLSCPTHQMACKWLREKHVVIVVIPKSFYADGSCGSWAYSIWADDNSEVDGEEEWKELYESYEQAIEKALKYSLKNLI